MDTENLIEITGANLVDVAKAAYSLSRPQGMGFLYYQEEELSDEEARGLITDDERCPLSLDYVKGRACKLTVFQSEGKLYIPKSWYDHSSSDLDKLLSRIMPDKKTDVA